jgi:signal transduction histidine kinase
MSTTIDDFRDFFRPEKEMTQFDVSHAVEEAVFIMQGTLKSHGIELVEKLDPGVEAEGFPSQFAQAVLNILANAKEEILARKVAAGRIEIELQRQGETILLRVSDNAGGIAPEILPKIFDPYFTTKDKGSGIGLYMAKTIIEHNMNGSISAANLGDGACFTLTVPVRQPKKN